MPGFQVNFYNTLLGSDGHARKVLQRAIKISQPAKAEEVEQIAQRHFERLECVPHWRLHASRCEVEVETTNEGIVDEPAGASRNGE